jgi:hypothetical protein
LRRDHQGAPEQTGTSRDDWLRRIDFPATHESANLEVIEPMDRITQPRRFSAVFDAKLVIAPV